MAAGTQAIGVYLFNRGGEPLLALPDRADLPVEPKQVEGLLALAGHFSTEASRASAPREITRMRYDDFGILGLRGDHAVVATVYRGTAEETLLPELERFLRRCDRRLRRSKND